MNNHLDVVVAVTVALLLAGCSRMQATQQAPADISGAPMMVQPISAPALGTTQWIVPTELAPPSISSPGTLRGPGPAVPLSQLPPPGWSPSGYHPPH